MLIASTVLLTAGLTGLAWLPPVFEEAIDEPLLGLVVALLLIFIGGLGMSNAL